MLFGQAAADAAEDVHVPLFVGTLKEAGNKVGFGGYAFFADGAFSFYILRREGVAVGAAEDMDEPFPLAGKDRGFYLFPGLKHGTADGAHSLFSRFPLFPALDGAFPVVGRGEKPVGEYEQDYSDENEEHDIEGAGDHAFHNAPETALSQSVKGIIIE